MTATGGDVAEPRVAGVRRIALRPTRLKGSTLAVALLCLGAAVTAGVLLGPVDIPPFEMLREFASKLPILGVESDLSSQESAILWQLRLPRVVLGGVVGALLAAAGATYQGVFKNPLADPYLLGAAAGAGLGATLVIAYGPDLAGWPAPVHPLPLAAFFGALLGVAGAYALGRSAGGRTTTSLVLAGVAVASFLTAVQTFVQQRESETLREVYSWILGRLATAGWREVTITLPYFLLTAVVVVAARRLIDVLGLGDEESSSVGIRPARLRLILVIAASLGTAAAVSVSGLIGFVGIIVPHTVRLVAGTSYRQIIPLSLIIGAAFMIVADILSRTLMSPAEIPIGVITAFFGAPFFILIMRTRGKIT